MSSGPDPVVIVGGSIASLVAADRLAAAGRAVELYLPDRGVGGGFLPLEMDGRRLELGARLIELSYDSPVGEPPPLDQYRPGPHGHRPFLRLVDEFVRDLAGDDLMAVPAPEVSVDGRRCSDYAFGGDLSGLAEVLEPAELTRMADEAARRLEIEGPHGVFDPTRETERWDRTYDDVGRAHTGDLFHERLIESIAAKILEGGTSTVVAGLHRKIWLPLFHPLTAWEACTDQLSYRPDRVMYTVSGGGMGEIVRRLVARIEASSLVDIRRSGSLTALEPSGDGAVVLELSGDATVHATWPIVGVGAQDLFAASGIPTQLDRVVANMLWLDLPDTAVRDLPSVLVVTEPGHPLFRVTESRADARDDVRTVCCELDHRRDDPARHKDVVVAALEELGVVERGAAIEEVAAGSTPAFVHPSPDNKAAFDAALARFAALDLPAHVVGGGTVFGADTFNEQLLQGLAVSQAPSGGAAGQAAPSSA